ncbi:peptide-binding protein [Bacillus sp. FJAT-27245]|uniref:peptide-binding protein n=1 Tax=Bacillus sp. FJAT-27245 TaxID=1684144 RepID=UPI000B26B354|nr:peptide-binding protein [Bacillus sp. FJAT-27245]
MKRSFILFLTMILGFSLFLAACSTTTSDYGSDNNSGKNKNKNEAKASTEPQKGGSLILGHTASPTLFNPYFSTGGPDGTIEAMLFSGLVTIDREFSPVGNLAEKWDVSDDDKTYTFYLRKGVKWHDGEDFTADDVVFTYNIPLHKDYTGPRALPFETVTEIKKVDDYTVTITLSEPYAPFITITAQFEILPEHILGNVPMKELATHEFNTKKPIGTGPFKFSEWKDGQYIKLDAFEDYYDGRPYLDSFVFKIVPDVNALMAQLQAGDINYTGITAEQLSTAKSLEDKGIIKLVSGPSNSWDFIGYNLRNPLFQDKKVRHALTHAIAKQKIIDAVHGGDSTIAHGPGSPANWAFNPNMPKYDYDPEKAKKLLEEAGWKLGKDKVYEKDGKKFEFTLKTTNGYGSWTKIAEIAQQQWKEIGVKVKIEVLEWSAFYEEIGPPKWNFDAVVSGWSIGSDPDPTWFWHTSEIKAGLNWFGYSNPEVDKLLEINTSIVDQEERKELIQKADAIVAEDQPYTFLYYPSGNLAHTPKLHGPKFSPANGYFEIHKWWMEQ